MLEFSLEKETVLEKMRKINDLHQPFGVFSVKKIILSSLLILATLTVVNFAQTGKSTQAPAAKNVAARQTSEIPFVNKVLPNGLEIIVLPDASVPIVTVELAVRNGSFTEPPDLNGLSHLYEHMFFKPNQASIIYQCELALNSGGLNDYGRRMCAEPLRLKSQIGSVSYLNNADQLSIHNGTTREEVVNYYYTTTSLYLGSAIRLINDAIRYPTFDEQEFKEEIQVVIGEIDRNESEPFFYLNRTLMDKLYYKYPTRKNALGTRETVLSATTEKMRTIQSRYYVPNNSALVVTGDVKAEDVFV